MHHAPTDLEATFAARKREEWLRDLSNQVQRRQEAKAQEKRDQELEEMRELQLERKMRENADEQLRSELAKRRQ